VWEVGLLDAVDAVELRLEGTQIQGDRIWCFIILHLAMDQYLYIPFLGDEHPFTSYFDVHQGDRVLTHAHLSFQGFAGRLSH